MAFDLDDKELEATRKMNGTDKEEISVGEYVRTKNGRIRKVFEVRGKTRAGSAIVNYSNNSVLVDIICDEKHSENILELIEVGDVLKMKEDNDIYYLGLENEIPTITYSEIKEIIKNGKCELLAILTHEQFEKNSYKVGE